MDHFENSETHASAANLPMVALNTPLMPALLKADVAVAQDYARASRSEATRRAYQSDWAIFAAWCDARKLDALPTTPAAVATFLAYEAQAGVKTSTIGRRLAAIGYRHRLAGFVAPQQDIGAQVIRDVVAGIRRTNGVRKNRKRAADGDMMRDMLQSIVGNEPRAIRDRALLAIGMAGAFRRSELVALCLSDLEMVPDGIRITIGKSKTDQEGRGVEIAIPEGKRIKPKQLLVDWINEARFTDGPVFRKLTPQGRITKRPMSDRGVAIVVKARAEAAGYDPVQFAGHSLRAGFLTEAARRGANIFKMREQSRHRSLDVLSDYVRHRDLFDDHAGGGFL
jgi:integrase